MTERARQERTAMRFRIALIGAGAVAALLMGLSGCDRSPATILRANQEPTLVLDPLRATGRTGAQRLYVRWRGEDADGRVDHYEWAVTPDAMLGAEIWTETNERERTIDLAALPPDAPGTRTLRFLSIRAVDELGAMSPIRRVGFYADNIPPNVFLVSPPASSFALVVPPEVTISWRGEDPDGVFTQEPVKYKFILIGASSEFSMGLALANPDSLRRYYANHPLGPWAGWDSTSAETTFVHYQNLTPGAEYVFCVIGFDEAGDYNPFFSFSSNMTHLRIGFGGGFGPQIGVFNEYVNYEYVTGGMENVQPVNLEVPAPKPVTINWYAIPMVGSEVTGYRWVLDPDDLFDETPRSGPDDLGHWSEWSLTTTSATLGPFPGGSLKRSRYDLYIEAKDSFGWLSLAHVVLVVVPSLPLGDRRELLIVDDTRLRGDMYLPGQTCPMAPSGPWPSASELDTALYARGGVPLRCPSAFLPPGALSTPGLFAGFDFDTIGTRGLSRIPYSVLTQYRRVLWLTDQSGAFLTKPPTDPIDPTTVLRSMCAFSQTNLLAAFVLQGGSLWIAGGGAGVASTDNYNDRGNDGGSRVYSSVGGRPELRPGRFMWDFARWQSEFRVTSAVATLHRSLGRNESDPGYSSLPSFLERRTQTSDPMPGRPYPTSVGIEFLQLDNIVTEEIGGEPTSVLDTLYRATASTVLDPDPAPPNFVVMTRYRGSAHGDVIFSGFAPWNFQRAQMRTVVDFVFQQLWGMALPAAPAAMRARNE